MLARTHMRTHLHLGTSSMLHRSFAPKPRDRAVGSSIDDEADMVGRTVARVAQVQQSAQATFVALLERQAEAEKIRGVLAMVQRYDSLFRLPTRIRRAAALQGPAWILAGPRHHPARRAGTSAGRRGINSVVIWPRKQEALWWAAGASGAAAAVRLAWPLSRLRHASQVLAVLARELRSVEVMRHCYRPVLRVDVEGSVGAWWGMQVGHREGRLRGGDRGVSQSTRPDGQPCPVVLGVAESVR